MQPNILLFLTDDHAQWAVGCYGNGEIHTPTLDYLAQTGACFDNAFTPTPVCSPARACLLTGRLASQHGVHDYLASADPAVNGNQWLSGETTLPQLLQKQGYETALIGKWHIGQDEHKQAGFDHWFSMGRNYPIYHEGPHAYGFDGEHHAIDGRVSHVLTDEAVRWLRQRKQTRPFCLVMGLYATHSPWEGQVERLVEQYRNCTFAAVANSESYPFGVQNLESTNKATRSNPREALAQYYAAVSEIDTAVGRVLDEIESLGLSEQTLTAYTADHGLNCGQHGIWGKGNGTLPLNMVEESIRIPLLLHWPQQIAPQQRAEMIDHLDTFQTVIDIAGATPPEGRNYAGRSFRPNLRAQKPPTDWRNAQYCEYGNVRMIRTSRYKLVRRYPDGPHELFDLLADEREMTNLFDDAEQQARITQLTAQLESYFNRFADPIKSGLNVLNLPQHNFTEAWRS